MSTNAGDPPRRAPLSKVQQAWVEGFGESAFKPGFTISDAILSHEPLDVDVLRTVLNALVARHEVLRTVVRRDLDPAVQEIHPPGAVEVEVWDHADPGPQKRAQLYHDIKTRVNAQGVDLEQLPVLRAILDRVGSERAILTLLTHHSCCDQWSLQLLLRDLAELYRAAASGRPSALPSAPQYRDFAVWEQQQDDDPAYLEHRRYWTTKLEGARILTLPSDRPVSFGSEGRYVAHRFNVPPETALRLRALASSVRGTEFMVVLACFCLLAHHVTGDTDVTVNTEASGRADRTYRDTVGLFLSFHPLRTQFAEAISFRDLLLRVRETCMESYRHPARIEDIEADNPDLMEPLRHSHNADLILGHFGNASTARQLELAGVAERLELTGDDEATDMPGGISWAFASSEGGGLRGRVLYNRAEFDETTITGWVEHLLHAIETVSAAPDAPWRHAGGHVASHAATRDITSGVA